MSTSAYPVLHKLIVHKLDHRNAPMPTLFDIPTTITPDVQQFFARHIDEGYQHPRSRSAMFLPSSPNTMRDWCNALLSSTDNDDVFVSWSHSVAQRLFDIMKRRPRISIGDLAVCVFSRGDSSPVLGFLKMDLQVAFVNRPVDVGGKTQGVLERVDDAITAVELQKCAFIPSTASQAAAQFDLRILDRQESRFYTSRPAASFFAHDFLECEVGMNAGDLTRAFTIGSYAWIRQQTHWEDVDAERFKSRVAQIVAGEHVDVIAFANEVIPNEADRESYVASLQRRGLQDLTFEPDPRERARLSDFLTFEGDDEMRLRVRREDYGDGRKVVAVQNPDRSYTVTVTTARWEGVLR